MSNESPGATTGDGRIGYSDFEAGCLAYLDQRSAAAAAAPEAVPGNDGDAEGQRLGSELYADGWSWCSGARNRSVYHAAPPRGGLVRSAELAVHLDISPLVSPAGGDEDLLGSGGWLDAVDDEATVKPSPRMRVPVRLHQTIAWSSTWRVPVLYFQATTMEGRPLSLDELTSSSLLHGFGTLDSALQGERDASSGSEGKDSSAAARFPPLSQGQDPFTDLPCFYLHPCETAGLLATLDDEQCQAQSDPPRGSRYLSYIESFIMLCATAIEMRL